MGNLYEITGMINQLKEVAVDLERKLMEPTNPKDVDYKALEEMAKEAEEVATELHGELIE